MKWGGVEGLEGRGGECVGGRLGSQALLLAYPPSIRTGLLSTETQVWRMWRDRVWSSSENSSFSHSVGRYLLSGRSAACAL